MILPNLDQLLKYKNPAVLKLYVQNYPKNKLTPDEAFTETLKYLWLVQKHRIDLLANQDNQEFPSQVFMPRSMREVDEMWHEFILFTEDYVNFCNKYFGEYMHHLPNIFDNIPAERHLVEAECEKLLPYIYDNLGEETVKIWWHSYLDEIAGEEGEEESAGSEKEPQVMATAR